jgi:hypothetical protein
MTHGSLFSGIGGFDLAAEWMGWENIFHCEWNPFGQKVLKHHFPNSISYNDITKTDFTIHRGTIDILTGGFPCQPYSLAGKRKGKEDSRHLFPEMLRAIREIQPSWIVGENVLGIINWGGDWYSTKCKLKWKMKGTKYSRLYFLLHPSTHRTGEKEFGLLLKEMLPTPAARDINGAVKSGKRITSTGKIQNYGEQLPNVIIKTFGKTSQLNPLFVGEMMGFPLNWTTLPFQSGETNQ